MILESIIFMEMETEPDFGKYLLVIVAPVHVFPSFTVFTELIVDSLTSDAETATLPLLLH